MKKGWKVRGTVPKFFWRFICHEVNNLLANSLYTSQERGTDENLIGKRL